MPKHASNAPASALVEPGPVGLRLPSAASTIARAPATIDVVEHRDGAGRAAPPVGEVGDPPERVRRGFGERERRDRAARRRRRAAPSGTPAWPRKHATTGFVARDFGRARDRARDVLGAGHERRHEDREQRVDRVVRERDAQARARTARRSRRRRGRSGCAPTRRARRARAARPGSLGSSSGTSRPAPAHASAARMPGPPALLTIATRRPGGNGLVREQHRGRRAARRACRRGSRRPGGTARRPRRRATRARRCATTRRGSRPRCARSSPRRSAWCGRCDARGARTCAGSRTTRGTAGSRRCAGRRPSTAAGRCR